VDIVLVSVSSGTIAAGVLWGLRQRKLTMPVIIHLGYSRSLEALRRYIYSYAPPLASPGAVGFVNEKYAYTEAARPGPTPPFPCNEFYDLKAFRWWMENGRARYGTALFWNIG
jgi:hypothetical protein